jgi:hypothetical protein
MNLGFETILRSTDKIVSNRHLYHVNVEGRTKCSTIGSKLEKKLEYRPSVSKRCGPNCIETM